MYTPCNILILYISLCVVSTALGGGDGPLYKYYIINKSFCCCIKTEKHMSETCLMRPLYEYISLFFVLFCLWHDLLAISIQINTLSGYTEFRLNEAMCLQIHSWIYAWCCGVSVFDGDAYNTHMAYMSIYPNGTFILYVLLWFNCSLRYGFKHSIRMHIWNVCSGTRLKSSLWNCWKPVANC